MQKKSLRLFWRFARQHPIQMSLAHLFPILAVLINTVLAPYILSIFVDKLQKGGINFDNSWPLILTYGLAIFVGEVIIWRLALYFTWTFQINGQREIYLTVFDKLAAEDLSFHANRFGGSLVSQSGKMIGAFERFWDTIIWSILPMVTTIVGSVVVLWMLGLWQYSTFLIIYTTVFAVVVMAVSKILIGRNIKEAEESNKNSGVLADMITNVATVKAFGREREENIRANEQIKNWHKASTSLKWGVLGATSTFSTMYSIGAIGAFVFAVYAAQHGVTSIGLIYLVFVYALNINRQIWEMSSITRTYNRVIGDAHDMTKILFKEPNLTDNSTNKLLIRSGEIEFKNVYFAYEKDKGEVVFSDFNLKIPAGQRVGLVGHSGSGKTTLTRLLLRFSDLDRGEILLDDQNIANFTQRSLHESISYVSQEPMLFHRSLFDNIAYGKQNASKSEVVDAAKKSHAMEFIDKLADGLSTLVGERGVKLSGGQRQRIAIARAILKDAPLLVLDEATSALDSESERLIQSSLEDLMGNRTSIVIAHRLSTIAKLDRIIVLEDGKIIEDGTHSELLKQNGIYAKLWSHQSGGFIE